jgi:hypothetical protein
MAYLKINDVDYSMYCNSLTVSKSHNYNAQTNAAGNTVADLINTKRTIDVGIIPLDDTTMATLQNAIDAFNVSISFRNPKTNQLETINCIIPSDKVDYYTIQANKVMYKAFTLQFIEL